ncbi:MAG: AMP-binding protein [Cyanobacteria bacterium J06621_8]
MFDNHNYSQPTAINTRETLQGTGMELKTEITKVQEYVQIDNLVELLQYRSKHQPDQTAYVFLQDGETESGCLTYRQLNRQARAIATQLQSYRGERALLLYPSGLEFITVFFACLYAGIIAVPVYPPRHNQKLSRLLAIASDAQAKLALTTSSILPDVEKRWSLEPGLAQLKLLSTDTVEAESTKFVTQTINPESLAFLQYTSGSTGIPKGVMVTHGNIIHNQQSIHQAFGHSEQSIVVGWLPLFHDMGLIGNVLQPLHGGFPSILMPPVAFLMKPIRWLKAIDKYRATTSGGPNFAYDLCVKKIKPEQLTDLDLSSWDLAFNGAEPIRAETLKQFTNKFTSCGFNYNAFYPCYGMAETTLFTTGGDKTQKPVIRRVKAADLEQNLAVETDISQSGSRKIAGCGRPYADTKVVIVNPNSLTRCEPGQVGEIWVRGGSVAAGYWNCPQATQETFQNSLKDTGESHFLRTGDLGFFSEGELFVTGRLKDLIILRGRNYYPQDIELTVENSHPALKEHCSAAFAVEIEGEERLTIACEVKRTYLRKLNTDEIVRSIQIAISTEHELDVYGVVLLKPGSIPKTSSGKIQRHACKLGFLEGSLNSVGQWQKTIETNPGTSAFKKPLTVDNIQKWLTDLIAKELGVDADTIESKIDFERYGMDSIVAVGIAQTIGSVLGVDISPLDLMQNANPEKLASFIAERVVHQEQEEIIALLEKKSTSKVFSNTTDNGQYLSLATIGRLIGGSSGIANQSPIIDPLMMAKNLRVAFEPLPKNFRDRAILQFREKLEIKLREAGVRVEPWLDATREAAYTIDIPFINRQIKFKPRTVKSKINAVITLEKKASIVQKIKYFLAEGFYRAYSRLILGKSKMSATRITQLLGWALDRTMVEDPTNTQTIALTDFNERFNDPNLGYQEKIPQGVKILLETQSQIAIGVGSEKISILNMNLSDSVYSIEQIDRFVTHSLIPKIYVPILPLPMRRFQLGVFDVEKSIYAEKLVEFGKRVKTTGLLPPGFKLSSTIESKAQKDFIDWIVNGRTGVSYGFVAYGEEPQYHGDKEVSFQEWECFSSVEGFNFQEVRQNNQGRWYVRTKLATQTTFKQVPDLWLVSARSGADKTNLNSARDILRVGLIKGQLMLQLPKETELTADIKPSYDVFVMAAIVLGASLYMPSLIEQRGLPMFHFHGYPSVEWFDPGEYAAGMKNPSLPCGTYESGVLNFLAMHQLTLQHGDNIKLASLTEPDHGTNIIAGNLEYLVTRLEAGIQQGQIELGGKHFVSLKKNLTENHSMQDNE